MDAERRALVRAHFDEEKLLRRAAGIAARELKGRGETRGRAADVFLGGLTCQGKVCRFDSVDALCPRVYELCDSYGLAAPVLRLLRDAALEAGEDILTCRDPLRPAGIAHLLIPARGLAFVTTGEGVRYEGKPYRRLRVDAMAEEKLTRAEKAHLRFIRRVRRALEEEAVASLKRAKRGHDALEALYRPCVDFDAVDALCDAEIARIGAYQMCIRDSPLCFRYIPIISPRAEKSIWIFGIAYLENYNTGFLLVKIVFRKWRLTYWECGLLVVTN